MSLLQIIMAKKPPNHTILQVISIRMLYSLLVYVDVFRMEDTFSPFYVLSSFYTADFLGNCTVALVGKIWFNGK